MPAGVRAMRSQMITGFSAATSIFAARRARPNRRCGGTTLASFGMCSASRSAIGFSCSSASSDEQHRRHRRRRGELVGAHRRFGEVLQRGRLIVPFDEIAHHAPPDRCAACTHSAPGRALVGFEDVADHDDRPARGRTRRCTSPWWRAAGRRCRGKSSPSACPRSWRSHAPWRPQFPRACRWMSWLRFLWTPHCRTEPRRNEPDERHFA